jgi:hypothetical protein
MRTCATCGRGFTRVDRPFLLRGTGMLYHRRCFVEALETLADYLALPGWKRAVMRFLAWARR